MIVFTQWVLCLSGSLICSNHRRTLVHDLQIEEPSLPTACLIRSRNLEPRKLKQIKAITIFNTVNTKQWVEQWFSTSHGLWPPSSCS